MNHCKIWLPVLFAVIAGSGCGPASPQKCTDYQRYGMSCGSATDCGEYMCLESKGEPCLAGACSRMCTKSCQSAADCPSESEGVVLESECRSGICVAVTCEKSAT